MRWFRPGPPPHQTALAMIGAKPGQQVAILGAGDGSLAAAVAGITGLNGRTVVTDPAPDAEARIAAAAAKAGTLVDFVPSGLAPGFDVVVVQRFLSPPNVPAQVLQAAAGLVRPGGRVVVIEGGMTAGWLGLGRRAIAPAIAGETIRDLLSAAGLRAARVLAHSEGTTYVEASKARA